MKHEIFFQKNRGLFLLHGSQHCQHEYICGGKSKSPGAGYVNQAPAGQHQRILKNFIRVNDDKTISLTNCCSVAGLGPGMSEKVLKAAPKVKENTRRDGSYEYYLSEPVRDNDAKGVGPFIWASLEMECIQNN